ncbi:Alpha-ketoglutarate-dependent dioxygenase alkB 4 [Schistosoma japonicum]|nr:Alpha-ketoglutarate-dependent dioxygenase alkB 4 [Schistosoma japonicum]
MESIISEIQHLSERFVTYIQRVKLLQNEKDVSLLNEAIRSLENDLKLLRVSYECHINHLVTTLNIVMDEKRDLEDELLARKENDTHFLDSRISIESSKNAKLLLEISFLKTDISEKSSQITALKLHIQQLQADGGEKDSIKTKLTEEINLLKQKLSVSEDLHAETAKQLQSALLKLSAQKKFTNERLSRSQNRVQWYISQFAEKDMQVEESRQKEASISTVISQLRAKTQEELVQYRQKVAEIYKKSLSSFQSQLVSEREENQLLKSKCLENDQKLLNLQRQIAELNSKVHSAEHHAELLQNSLESLSREHIHLRKKYEKKIQELEASISSNVSDVELAHSKEQDILKELEKFKGILEIAEERLDSNVSNKEVCSDDVMKDKQEDSKHLASNRKNEINGTCNENIASRLGFRTSSEDIQSSVTTPIDETHNVFQTNSTELRHIGQINLGIESCNQNSPENTLMDKNTNGTICDSSRTSLCLSGSNAIGSLQICEIDPNVWQKYGCEKVNEYTFSADIRMSPRTIFTLWSNSAILPSNFHNGGNEFRCPNVSKWFNSPNYITVVSNAYDEILAWLAPSVRCFTSRGERENTLQYCNSPGIQLTSIPNRNGLMIAREKSTNKLSASRSQLQQNPINSSLNEIDHIQFINNASNNNFNELYNDKAVELIDRLDTTKSIVSRNNNQNNKNHNCIKRKNLISLNPQQFIINDNKLKTGYSNLQHYNLHRHLSINHNGNNH